MPRVGDFIKAKAFDETLSKNLDTVPQVNVAKDNLYYKYAENLRQSNIYSQSIPTIKKAITLNPVPPSSVKPENMTPKISFVKKAGTKRRRNGKKTRKNRKRRQSKKN
jgi:hypothetical protein